MTDQGRRQIAVQTLGLYRKLVNVPTDGSRLFLPNPRKRKSSRKWLWCIEKVAETWEFPAVMKSVGRPRNIAHSHARDASAICLPYGHGGATVTPGADSDQPHRGHLNAST